jgi:hypothetical protein
MVPGGVDEGQAAMSPEAIGQSRTRLLDAAMLVIRAKGYAGTTVEGAPSSSPRRSRDRR